MEDKKMKDKKWRIIFDYDDTLIRHDVDKELKLMAEYLNLEYTKEFKRQLIEYYANMSHFKPNERITLRNFEEYAYKSLPLLAENNLSLSEIFDAERYKDEKLSLLTEGAKETLDYLVSKGYYLCVLTNGFMLEQYRSLKYQGLLPYFEKIYAWDSYFPKPNEKAFLRALAGTNPEENIMVGNSILHDIVPAKKLGIYTFGIHLNEKEKEITMPDVELNSLSDLKKYL